MLCSLCNKTTLSLFKHLRLNVIKHPNSSTILGNYFSKHMFFIFFKYRMQPPGCCATCIRVRVYSQTRSLKPAGYTKLPSWVLPPATCILIFHTFCLKYP